jgi:flavodoxin
MKTLIICDSVHRGNTKKIADVLAKELDAPILTSAETTEEKMREYDLIGFGSGIYMGQHYKGLLAFVDGLTPRQDRMAFIFSTSGFGEGFMDKHHKNLRDKLQSKGFKIVGEFSCKAYDDYGPLKLIGGINKGKPDEKDFEKAREFAKELKGKLQ